MLVTLSSPAAKATYDARTGTDSKYAKIDSTKVDGKYTIQLGEDLYRRRPGQGRRCG